jgi:hypothetical protein
MRMLRAYCVHIVLVVIYCIMILPVVGLLVLHPDMCVVIDVHVLPSTWPDFVHIHPKYLHVDCGHVRMRMMMTYHEQLYLNQLSVKRYDDVGLTHHQHELNETLNLCLHLYEHRYEDYPTEQNRTEQKRKEQKRKEKRNDRRERKKKISNKQISTSALLCVLLVCSI